MTNVPQEDDIIDAIRAYCDENTPPEDIILLAPSFAEEKIKDLQRSPRFVARLPGASRYIDEPPVDLISFDVTGLHAKSNSTIGKIVHAGLLHMFRHHCGLIRSSPAFHYVKPSTKHCDAFLRTANVLVRGIEIQFIAACCLSCCPSDMTRIYTDTGAIHSIAFAILGLLADFGDQRRNSVIDSFGSYTYLKDYPFIDQERTLVLISASTSGNLIDDVVRYAPQLRHNHIATVFYLGKSSTLGRVLCDLTFHPTDNPDGFEEIKSFPPDACPLCGTSTAIRMSEEQFIPQGPQIQSLIIVAKDAPDDLSSFFQEIHGHGIVRANYREADSSAASREVYLDLLPLFSTELFTQLDGFRSRFERTASHLVSANTKRIVHLNDKASFFLAGRVATFANQNGVKVDILSAKALQEQQAASTQIGGTTIIVASAMSTGRSLTEVSKTLRFAQKGGAIKYLIAFSRPKDVEHSKSVFRDLRYGENDASEHHVAILSEFYFPSWRPEGKTSWEAEYELLATTADRLPTELEERCESIRLSSSAQIRGLSDNLFLLTPLQQPLVLRPSFAFWRFRYGVNVDGTGRAPSQADVYTTIVAVLHKLRNAKQNAERSLRQSDQIRRIISPRCFERFNDGIIQASLLRAAHLAEIDYSIDDQLSEDMRSIVAAILDQSRSSAGEAANEFLLAIALGRLKLSPPHLASLCKEFGDDARDAIGKFLFDRISRRSVDIL